MNKVRQEVELEKSRAKQDGSGCEKDLEICIRAKNNAWVIARVTKGKELYMVLEKANETLLYAADAVEKFSNRYPVWSPIIGAIGSSVLLMHQFSLIYCEQGKRKHEFLINLNYLVENGIPSFDMFFCFLLGAQIFQLTYSFR